MLAGALLVSIAACGSSATSASGATQSGLQSVARTYANAWLSGNPEGITSARSRTCSGASSGATSTGLAAVLTAVRSHTPGVNLSNVKVSAIRVRNFDGTTGEAAAEFAPTPGFVAGTDNWIRYAYENGTWKVVDCTKLPFGGNSTIATAEKP